MSLQKIINNAETLVISRSKLAGQTISRSGRIRSSIIASAQPFKFTVKHAPMSSYEKMRDVLEQIDRLDRVFTETIDIGSSNTGLSWVTEYKGDLSDANMDLLTVDQVTGSIIVLNTNALVGTNTTDILFKKGDYLQFADGYKYPYTVTQDVQVGIVATGSKVVVPVNRGVIEQNGYTIAGSNVVAGTDVRWQVKMLEKPDFTLEPARYLNFNSDFQLMEVIED